MLRKVIILLSVGFFSACTPQRDFEATDHPPVPDYSQSDSWACLPTKHNPSDSVPFNTSEKDMQATASVDVFYIYLSDA